ncbi:MAG: hypothetical protein ACI4ML_01725 [Aristaeellaceae bacterium]
MFRWIRDRKKPSSTSVDSAEWDMCTDYTNRCGNCHEWMPAEDKYCRHCGTKRGGGKFLPYTNIMECIYGPMPMKRLHQCPACRYEWEACLMIDEEDYCPMCGSRARVIREEDDMRSDDSFFP